MSFVFIYFDEVGTKYRIYNFRRYNNLRSVAYMWHKAIRVEFNSSLVTMSLQVVDDHAPRHLCVSRGS